MDRSASAPFHSRAGEEPGGSMLGSTPPFDAVRLDALMAERGVDVVLATSLHATQYLLGGYRFFMYGGMDSIGLSRYLPVAGYVRGAVDEAFYVGAGNEAWGTDVTPLWVPTVRNVSWGSASAAEAAVAELLERGHGDATIAIEAPYLSADAMDVLRRALPGATFVDGVELLEELRIIKTPQELDLIGTASAAIVDAMVATFAGSRPGETKAQIAERLRQEQTARGLSFAYCLIAAGTDLNRAPSSFTVQSGDVISLDSGASASGYVADLARMGVLGEPTPAATRLLADVAAIQAAARAEVRPGGTGRAIFAAAHAVMDALPHGSRMGFLAHGTGLATHEGPRLTDTGSPPYPATHRDRPLEPGMVISVETHIADPVEGFIKLEDTLFVTADGHHAAGDHARELNVVAV